MFKDNVTPVKICNYNEALAWANSASGKNYLISRNNKIKNLFPLTENFLRSNYLNNDFTGYKTSFPDVNCANDTLGLFVATYGYLPGGTNATGADNAQSSGLNPFFGLNLNAGFDFGDIGKLFKDLAWILLLVAGIYLVNKND